MTRLHVRRMAFALFAAVILSVVPAHMLAQEPADANPPAPPSAKAGAPEDLTGQWMSLVTEDWGYRMIMPLKGDFRGVPLNPEGKRVAGLWDPAKPDPPEEACRAYGVGGVMRM